MNLRPLIAVAAAALAACAVAANRYRGKLVENARNLPVEPSEDQQGKMILLGVSYVCDAPPDSPVAAAKCVDGRDKFLQQMNQRSVKEVPLPCADPVVTAINGGDNYSGGSKSYQRYETVCMINNSWRTDVSIRDESEEILNNFGLTSENSRTVFGNLSGIEMSDIVRAPADHLCISLRRLWGVAESQDALICQGVERTLPPAPADYIPLQK